MTGPPLSSRVDRCASRSHHRSRRAMTDITRIRAGHNQRYRQLPPDALERTETGASLGVAPDCGPARNLRFTPRLSVDPRLAEA